MLRSPTWFRSAGIALPGILALLVGCTGTPPYNAPTKNADPVTAATASGKEPGTLLPSLKPREVMADAVPRRLTPVEIVDCRLAVVDKQDVPSGTSREGQILFIGTDILSAEEEKQLRARKVQIYEFDIPVVYREIDEDRERLAKADLSKVREFRDDNDRKNPVKKYLPLKDGDPIEPNKIRIEKEPRKFRRLQEGDVVKKDQLLAMIDPIMTLDELRIKDAKLVASEADWIATVKTLEEAKQRYETQKRLINSPGGSATSREEYRGAQLTVDRYIQESVSKEQAINLARREFSQVHTALTMHEIRSKIDGVVKTILKQQGEAVGKQGSQETILQIQDPGRVRVEGLVEVQYVDLLERMKAAHVPLVVEPSQPVPPLHQFHGHLQAVNSVAVSTPFVDEREKDPKENYWIVSGSEDRTVRVWDWNKKTERLILPHPSAVRAVACTGPGSKTMLCLSGTADGQAWLWDLNPKTASEQPLRRLAAQHNGPINCVAFSWDGQHCFTGGDDRAIYLWETATGKLVYQFPEGHKARVTSLQFLPDSRLASAGGDNTLLMWKVGLEGARLEEKPRFSERGGDVTTPGISFYGERVLLDQGRDLRVLSLPGGRTEAVLRNASGSAHFTTMALFSPDDKLILTVCSSEGRLQLWRAPEGGRRTYEIRQLIWPGAPATCGAFASRLAYTNDGSFDKVEGTRFIVTGTKDRQVLVWSVPSDDEVNQQMKADIMLVERSQDVNSRQVRLWAQMDNPVDNPEASSTPGANGTKRYRLVPGATATLVAYPE